MSSLGGFGCWVLLSLSPAVAPKKRRMLCGVVLRGMSVVL